MNAHDMNLYHTYFIFLLHTISHFSPVFLETWEVSWRPLHVLNSTEILEAVYYLLISEEAIECWNMLGHPLQRFKKRLYRKWSLFNGVFHVFFKLC